MMTVLDVSILHSYGDMWTQIFWGQNLDFLGSRYIIGHVTITEPVQCISIAYSEVCITEISQLCRPYYSKTKRFNFTFYTNNIIVIICYY